MYDLNQLLKAISNVVASVAAMVLGGLFILIGFLVIGVLSGLCVSCREAVRLSGLGENIQRF